MNRFTLLLTTAALLVPQLASGQTASFPVTVRHATGSATIPRPPQRVAALSLRTLELLLALGVQPAGYASSLALPNVRGGQRLNTVPFYESRVKGGLVYLGTTDQPSLEAVLALKPDLIVDEDQGTRLNALSRIAPTLQFAFYLGDGWKKALPVLGRALGREAQVNTFLRDYDGRVRASRARLAALQGQSVTALVAYDQTLIALDPRNALGSLFGELGLNVRTPGDRAGDEHGFVPISLETLPALQTDHVVLINRGGDGALVRQVQDLAQRGGRRVLTYTYPENLAVAGPLSNLQVLSDLTQLLSGR